MRPKGNNFYVDCPVAREVTRILNATPKSQADITKEIGLKRSNMLTMIKQGRSKLPIRLGAPLARAAGADPKALVVLALKTYEESLVSTLIELNIEPSDFLCT